MGKAQGTGPGGRIVAADVQKLIESGGGGDESALAAHESAAAPSAVGALPENEL